MLFHGLLQAQKVLKVQENSLYAAQVAADMLDLKLTNKD